MKKILLICLLAWGMQVFAASPKLQQLDAKATAAINDERWMDAVAVMQIMIATKEPLPKDFKYWYGLSLAMTKQYEKAYANVDEYMEEQGRNAQFYADARKLGRELWRQLVVQKGDAWIKQQEKKYEEIKAKEEAANQLAAKQLEEIKEAEKLAARPNFRNLVILGGGGTLKTAKSTAFDATLTAASAFYQRGKWNAIVAFDTGREETQRLLNSAFANVNTVTSFTQNNFNVIVNHYGKASAIKPGDQVLLVIDGYGALKNGDETSHSVAVYDVEEPFDLNTLKGAKTLSLDLLKLWAEATRQKGAKLAIVDFTSHSGNTLALANANTCVVSGTGPLHFRSGIFVQELFKKMQAGKSLENVFLEARKDTADNAFPMISTAQGVAINQEVYPLLAPYLYIYADDPLNDKMVPYLTEALSDAGYAKREQQYKEMVRRLNGLQGKNNANAAAIQNLKVLLSQYKEKQDAYINGARSMGAGNLSRREQITGEAELGGMKGRQTTNLSWAEIVTSDTEQILKNLRSAREGGRNAQFLADVQAAINMHTKVQERKNEILAAYPSLKEYKSKLQNELAEIKKASGLAVEIAKQERVIYDALYNSTAGERERSSGNACKNFVF